MKRFLFIPLLLFAAMVVAQDVIITTEPRQIQAKITEISPSEIRYKDFDNVDGPTFVLPVSQVNSIIYSTGKVQLFNGSAPNQVQGSEPMTMSTPAPSSAVAPTMAAPSTQAVANTKGTKSGRIYRDNGEYVYNDVFISSKEVERILKRENAEAYAAWQKSNGLAIGGSIMLGAGVGFLVGSLCIMKDNPKLSLGLDAIALGLDVGAIVMLCMAPTQRTKAIDIYNRHQDGMACALEFRGGLNNVGLALRF